MTSAGAEFSGHDGFSPRFRSMIWNNNKGVWGGGVNDVKPLVTAAHVWRRGFVLF